MEDWFYDYKSDLELKLDSWSLGRIPNVSLSGTISAVFARLKMKPETVSHYFDLILQGNNHDGNSLLFLLFSAALFFH